MYYLELVFENCHCLRVPHASEFISNFCTQSQNPIQALPLNSNHLFAHHKHCLYILRVIWDKLEPYLVYHPIFICKEQSIKTHHVRLCAHNLWFYTLNKDLRASVYVAKLTLKSVSHLA